MSDEVAERFICEQLATDPLSKKVHEAGNKTLILEVPDGGHCTGGYKNLWERKALHPAIQKRLKQLSGRKLHFEVFNKFQMVETRLGPNGEVTKVEREDPSCLIVVCYEHNPYKYVPDISAGLGAGALAGTVTFIVLFFLVSLSPQWAFLAGLAVFLGMTPAIGFAKKYRVETI